MTDAPFTTAAAGYDTGFSDTRLGRWVREMAWRYVDAAFQPGDQVLEIAAGTGVDALHLAERGVQVTVTDQAEAMVDVARERFLRAGEPFAGHTVDLDEPETLPIGPFDGVLSNFGGLNCVQELPRLARALAERVRPGGRLVFVVMGPNCPWEWLWFLAKGRPHHAFRRYRTKARAHVAGGPAFDVFYPSAKQLADAFAPHFALTQTAGLGTLLPPSYAGSLVDRLPNLFARFRSVDERYASHLTNLSDHYVAIFEAQAGGEGANPSVESALSPERLDALQPFIDEYAQVRHAEGRGSNDPAYYRALPYQDLTGRHSKAWAIRAAGFRAFLRGVVQPLELWRGRPLDVLDLGSGNGWLSYRMAERGHRAVAVDLQTNAFDGLGASVHYDHAFETLQAEFDDLPFGEARFDLVVFNASIHYATDYDCVLTEALRVLRPEGRLVVLDSPVYEDGASGRQMIEEREAYFERTFGTASTHVPSRYYLTFDELGELSRRHDLRMRHVRPRYPLRWRLRPWIARGLQRREPATFGVFAWTKRLGLPADLEPALVHEPRGYDRVQTRWIRWRYRDSGTAHEQKALRRCVRGLHLQVDPGVFDPVAFRTAQFSVDGVEAALADRAARLRVLDLGTGTGISALAAARAGARVDAIDVDPRAVACARANAAANPLGERVRIHEGDLFDPVRGERFDVVHFNPPYYLGVPTGPHGTATRSEDLLGRFARNLPAHLTPDGYGLVLLSTQSDANVILSIFAEAGLTVSVFRRQRMAGETLVYFDVRPA
ncbi:MAG: methyltransferase domain-containing protein [Bacteroidota bacterium]